MQSLFGDILMRVLSVEVEKDEADVIKGIFKVAKGLKRF